MQKEIIPGGYGDYSTGYGAYGTIAVEFEERVNFERLRKQRLERAKEELFKRRNLGSFLAIDEKNIKYITGTYTPLWTTPASGLRYALLPRTTEWPVLYEQGDIMFHTMEMAPWIPKNQIKYAITGASWIGRAMGRKGHEIQVRKMVAQIKEELSAHGVLKEPMGIDVFDPFLIEAFKKEGIEVSLEGAEAMLDARRIKTKDEIECLRIGATIGDAIFQVLRENIKPGVNEYELMAKMLETACRYGANIYGEMIVVSGRYTWPNLRCCVGRVIRPGDIVYADVYTVGWNGYRICYYRTFSCGQPSESIKDAYQRAYDWLYSAIKAIKPGVTTKDIAEKFPEASKVWGWYGVTSEDQAAANNWGHGIGLSLYEPPIIWRAVSLEAPEKLEPGMTFAIETQEGDPKTRQGVRIEEMVVVTETGVELLTKWPVDEITVC